MKISKAVRLIAAVMSAILLFQSGAVYPLVSSAEGETAKYVLINYNDKYGEYGALSSNSGDEFKVNDEKNYHFNLNGSQGEHGTVTDSSPTITLDKTFREFKEAYKITEDPGPIVGMKFVGWANSKGELISDNDLISKLDMYSGYGYLSLNATWEADTESSIEQLSLLQAKDEFNNLVDNNIVYTETDGSEIKPENPEDDLAEYLTKYLQVNDGEMEFNAVVPESTRKLDMSFTVTDPYTKVEVNVENGETKKSVLKDTTVGGAEYDLKNKSSSKLEEDDWNEKLSVLNNTTILGDEDKKDDCYSVSWYKTKPLDTKTTSYAGRTYYPWLKRAVWANNIPISYGDNRITITVTPTNPKGVSTAHSSSYVINVKCPTEHIELNYGNTPYARIAQMDGNSLLTDADKAAGKKPEEAIEEAMKLFDETYKIKGREDIYAFPPEAWKADPVTDKTEIYGGYEPQPGEFINYDKDYTAFVTYLGDVSYDPGIKLMNGNTEIPISEENPVEREIEYTVINGNYPGWGSGTEEIQQKTIKYSDTLKGAATDNYKISFTQNYQGDRDEVVKPGIYKIKYTATINGEVCHAQRNFIILPKLGDWNLDNYVNSLDTSVLKYYDNTEDSDNLKKDVSYPLYKYRALDINYDGTVNSSDSERVYVRPNNNMGEERRSYTYIIERTEKDPQQTDYTVPATASGSKAQIYLDFLKMDETTGKLRSLEKTTNDEGEEIDETDNKDLRKGSVFWIGVRIDGIDKTDLKDEDIYSMTLSLDYDTRNLSIANIVPDTDNGGYKGSEYSDVGEAWKNDLRTLNMTDKYGDLSPNWGEYNLTSYSSFKKIYKNTVDSTRAKLNGFSKEITDNPTNGLVSTFVFDIVSNNDTGTKKLQDGYLLLVPMVVTEKIPATDDRIAALALGSQTFTMSFGKYGKKKALWNTHTETTGEYAMNPVTENLTKYVEYMQDNDCRLESDYTAEFARLRPNSLRRGTYGTPYSSGDVEGVEVRTFPLVYLPADSEYKNYEARLPKGLEYISEREIIEGTPKETGNFIFYIDTTVYVLEIAKKTMHISPEVYDEQGNAQTGTIEKVYGDPNPENIETYYAKEDFYDDGTEEKDTAAKLIDELNTDETSKAQIPEWKFELAENAPVGSSASISCVLKDGADNYGSSKNYKFVPLEGGKLEVKYQRPLTIKKITNIPAATAENKQEADSVGARTFTVTTGSASTRYNTLEVEGLYTSESVTDNVSVEFEVEYPNDPNERLSADKSVPVTIKNVKMQDDLITPGNSNYYVKEVAEECNTGVTGVIRADEIVSLSSAGEDPRYVYTYGDQITLNTGYLNVNYKSGKVDTIPFSDLVTSDKTRGISLYFYNKYTEAKKEIREKTKEINDDNTKQADEKAAAVAEVIAVGLNKAKVNADYLMKMTDWNEKLCAVYDNYGENINPSDKMIYEVANAFVMSKKELHIKAKDYNDHIYGSVIDTTSDALKYAYEVEQSDLRCGDQFGGPSGDDTTVLNMPNENDGFVRPYITCVAPINEPFGDNPDAMVITGGNSENYTFVFSTGTLHTQKRPIYLDSLISESAITKLQAKDYLDDTTGERTEPEEGYWSTKGSAFVSMNADGSLNEDNQALLTKVAGNDESGLIEGDTVTVDYIIKYSDIDTYVSDEDHHVFVDIKSDSFTLDDAKDRNINYELITDENTRTNDYPWGDVISDGLDEFVVNSAPDKNEYTYGETLDLTGLNVTVYRSSGQVITLNNPTAQQLADNDIALYYENDTSGSSLTERSRMYYSNSERNIRIVGITTSGTQSEILCNPVVLKKDMLVKINGTTITYGDDPGLEYTYNASDFEWGETVNDAMFTYGLTPPVITLKNKTTNEEYSVNDRLTVGGYYIILSGGEADNYNFIFEDDIKELSVIQRGLRVNGINNIPVLEAKRWVNNSSDLYDIKDVTADNKSKEDGGTPDIIVSNLASDFQTSWSKDLVRIKYTVTYNGSIPTYDATVGITYQGFDDGDGGYDNENYYIDPQSISRSSGGVIEANEISKIEILEQPTLSYTYGSLLDLNSGQVAVTYSSTLETQQPQIFKFSELPETIGITLVPPSEEDLDEYEHLSVKITDDSNTRRLTVAQTGYKLLLTSSSSTGDTLYENVSDISDSITVEPKTLRVKALDDSFIYGEEPPKLSLMYYDADLVYGEEIDDVVNEEPALFCTVNDEYKNNRQSRADAGEYEIVVSGGNAVNYRFAYENGTMTVDKRILHITSIVSGVPVLTSKQLFDERENISHIVEGGIAYNSGDSQNVITVTKKDDAEAKEKQGLFDGDRIGISYTAIYSEQYDNVSSDKEGVNVIIRDVVLLDSDDEHNYTLEGGSVPLSAECGTVLTKRINKITITNDGQPRLDYTYGETLDLTKEGVTVDYDSGEQAANTAYRYLSDFGISMHYTSTEQNPYTGDDPVNGQRISPEKHDGRQIMLVYDNNPDVNTLTDPLTVNKREVVIRANDLTMTYGDNVTSQITYDSISKAGISSEGNVLGYSVLSELPYDERAINLTSDLKLVCYENEEEQVPVSDNTPVKFDENGNIAGYTIKISGAESANYSFKYEPQTALLTIDRREIDVTKLTVPDLTSEKLYKENESDTHSFTDVSASNNPGENQYLAGFPTVSYNIVNDDTVGVKFDVTYNDELYSTVTEDHEKAVVIDNIRLDESIGKSKNYKLKESLSILGAETKGMVYKRKLTSINITAQPKHDYIYGDPLVLGTMLVKIVYDSTEEIENIKYDGLGEYGIIMQYTDDADGRIPQNGEKVTIDYHNDKTITLLDETNSGVRTVTAEPITVSKRQIKLKANDLTMTYGDEILSDVEYNVYGRVVKENEISTDNVLTYSVESELATGDTQIDGLQGLKILCEESQNKSADRTTPTGYYTIKLSGGESDNYIFDFTDGNGTLTVVPREIDVNTLTVPDLSLTQLYNESLEGVNEHRITGVRATNNSSVSDRQTATYENDVNDDTIGVIYEVIYTADYNTVVGEQTEAAKESEDKTPQAASVKVTLENIALDPGMPSYRNYVLKSPNEELKVIADNNTYGIIPARRISQISVTTQPKNSYSYGDPLELSEMRVEILYNSGEKAENTEFSQLGEYGITAAYKNNETVTSPREGEILTITDHNENKIVLSDETNQSVTGETDALSVSKRLITLKPKKTAMTYGESILSAVEYNADGRVTTGEADHILEYEHDELANGDTKIDGLTGLWVICRDESGNPVSFNTPVKFDEDGEIAAYTIEISEGAEASNYAFALETETLTINKRPLYVKHINNIPELTALIWANPEAEEYELSGEADNVSQDGGQPELEVENLGWDEDLVRIAYAVKYTGHESSSNADVEISYRGFSDGDGSVSYANNNYDISSESVSSQNNGRVEANEITAISIVSAPDMEYTYGESLDLNGGEVNITYRSGKAQGYTFAELPAEAVTVQIIPFEGSSEPVVTITDDASKILYAAQTGSRIRLSSKSIINDSAYESISAVTNETLTVHKKQLHVTAQHQEMTYGDEPPALLAPIYTEGDFVYGEDESVVTEKPAISCEVISNPNKVYDAGQYVISLTGGSAANYEIVPANETLTINQREIDVISLKVPDLTSAKLYDEREQDTHVFDGVIAANHPQDEQFSAEYSDNIVGEDTVGVTFSVTYSAIYSNITENTEQNVIIGDTIALNNSIGESRNYKLKDGVSVLSAETKGRILVKRLASITISNDAPPKLSYIYGDTLDVSAMLVDILYDSGEPVQTGYDGLEALGIKAEYVKDNTAAEVNANDVMTIDDHNGAVIRLSDKTNPEVSGNSGAISVIKRELTLTPVNLTIAEDGTLTASGSKVYGDTILSHVTYNENGRETEGSEHNILGYEHGELVNNDTRIDGLTGLRIVCYENKEENKLLGNISPVLYDEEGNIASYTMEILDGATAHNYDIRTVTAPLEVVPRPLYIRAINNIPMLTAAQIWQSIDAETYTVPGSADNADKTSPELEADNLGRDDDVVRVAYDAVYGSSEPQTGAEVEISNYRFDNGDGSVSYANKNYRIDIQNSVRKLFNGKIEANEITNVEINTPPEMTYTYGESLDLNGGEVAVTYRSGVTDNVSFAELPGAVVIELVPPEVALSETVRITDDDSTRRLYAYQTGYRIRLTSTSIIDDSAYTSVSDTTDQTLTVNKKQLHVTARNQQMTYGDEPPALWSPVYTEEDFVYGENESAVAEKPVIGCEVISNADRVYDAGEYPITLMGGTAANYEIVPSGAVFTVERREIDVESLSVPDLTSAKLYNERERETHLFEGVTAANKPSEGEYSAVFSDNIVGEDTVAVSFNAWYTADYAEITENTNVPVTIDADTIALNEGVGKSKNYRLAEELSVLSSETIGRILVKRIQSISIPSDAQPKTSYVYGETLDLSGMLVDIMYDSGESVQTGYDGLAALGIKAEYVKNGSAQPLSENDVITIAAHNGAVIRLSDETNPSVSNDTNEITVVKRTITLRAKDIPMTYGETVLSEAEYNESGRVTEGDAQHVPEYEYSGLIDGDEKIDGLRGLKLVIKENEEKTADSVPYAGSYTIEPSGAEADNYSFSYENGTLTVSPREINITSVTVPDLTSAKLYSDYQLGINEHALGVDASNKPDEDEFTFTAEDGNIVGNDIVGIKFNVVYEGNYPDINEDSSVKVKVQDFIFDEDFASKGYTDPKNYTLKPEADMTVSAADIYGTIRARRLTGVTITEQPRLYYTYGDTLELDQSGIGIAFDSGEGNNISYNDTADYGISIVYTGTERTPQNGEAVTYPFHNGKTMTINADCLNEPLVTEAITVNKKLLTIASCTARDIVYDGHTTQTSGVIMLDGSVNGDTAEAAGVFNFENALAGEDKTVYVTDISISDELSENYYLEATEYLTTASILKASITPSAEGASVTLSEYNVINAAAPALSEELTNAGAKYQYSIDNGETWSESGEFSGLALGQSYTVLVKFAETDNYAESESVALGSAQTYPLKITALDIFTKESVKTLFTRITSFETEEALITELQKGEPPVYDVFENSEQAKFEYPLSLIGDRELFVSVAAPTYPPIGGGGGGGTTTNLVVKTVDADGKMKTITSSGIEGTPGEKVTLNASFSAYVKDSTVTWTSSDESIVRVDSTGTLTFVSPGKATVTATSNEKSSLSKTFNVTVDAVEATPAASSVPGTVTESPAPEETLNPDATRKPSDTYTHYIDGEGGRIYPDNLLTRAEAAKIFAAQYGFEEDSANTDSNIYPDVRANSWYAPYVSFVSEKGIMNGYEDGSFRPEANITRAEVSAMIARYLELEPEKGRSGFTDVLESAWYSGYIKALSGKDIITGYDNNSFRPEANITRAEAFTLVNRMTGRSSYSHAEIDKLTCPFADLNKTHWAYYEIMIAATDLK